MTFEEMKQAHPNISEEKLKLLQRFADTSSLTNSNEMLTRMKQCQAEAKAKNIHFTKEEQTVLIDYLMKAMSPAEQAKTKQLLQMIKRYI